MKKTQIISGLAMSAMLVAVTACSDDRGPGRAGEGQISPVLDVDASVVQSRQSRAVTGIGDITVDDLALSLVSADGTVNRTWAGISEFDTDEAFKVGEYTMTASYGSLEDEGFEKPYVTGSSAFTVSDNRTTDVALTASLANSMVTVTYTDEFRNYFSAYSAQIHSAGGAHVDYPAEETRPAYMRPGNIDIFVDLTRPTGESVTLQPASFVAEAKHHYTVTIDVNASSGGAGTAQLVISFDDTVAQEDVVIDLSDELMNAPAPTIDATGFGGGNFEITEGSGVNVPLTASLLAHGGFKSVTLTTQSTSLIAQGWPAEIDLMAATDAQKQTLKNLGLSVKGLWHNPEKMAIVDFTEAVKHIGYVENDNAYGNTSTFTLVVKDELTKTSDPVTFSVNVDRLSVALDNAAELILGQSTAEFDLTTNYPDVKKDLTVEYSNDRGTWNAAPIQEVAPKSRLASDTYRVKVAIPENVNSLWLRATVGSARGNDLQIERVIPEFKIAATAGDIWATKAVVKFESTDASPSVVASSASIYLAEGNGAFTKVASPAVSGVTATVTGLKPGTEYRIKASLTADPENCPNILVFTTEEAAAVPNGDFENLTETRNVSSMEQGGPYTRVLVFGSNMQNHAAFTVKEPVGWGSTNDLTCNLGSSRLNTWYVTPSVYNTSLYWLSTIATQGGMGGQKETPDIYKGLSAHNGSNAMVVRNVSWDPAGAAIEVHKKTAVPDGYYSEKVPATSRTSAGRLFLGSSSNEGAAFTSRPVSLTCWYKYVNDAQDTSEKGMVTVTVLSGETVIGSGSALASAVNDFTQLTVPVTYSNTSLKATKVKISVTSSNHTSEANIKTTAYATLHEQAKRGAILTIDNLTFNY